MNLSPEAQELRDSIVAELQSGGLKAKTACRSAPVTRLKCSMT
ncbi:hypothetical protein AB2F98_01635 [Escherichia coli]